MQRNPQAGSVRYEKSLFVISSVAICSVGEAVLDDFLMDKLTVV